MGSVCKFLRDYGVVRKKYVVHKYNHNPSERRAPNCSCLLCMSYVISMPNFMARRSLSWCNSHEAAYVLTPDVAHLMEFELC